MGGRCPDIRLGVFGVVRHGFVGVYVPDVSRGREVVLDNDKEIELRNVARGKGLELLGVLRMTMKE